MVVKQEVDVDVIKRFRIISGLTLLFMFSNYLHAQNTNDTSKVFKKRVLENVEIDLLSSFYSQKGENASVTGGIGNEKLTDFASNIVVSIPIKDDNILTTDLTISAYTSASSSNLNPFTGASSGDDDDDDNDGRSIQDGSNTTPITGSPWVASTGASASDVWINGTFGFSHSSDDRNKISGLGISISNEYDYASIGFSGSYAHLFNSKNTEINLKTNVYLDSWKPEYPTELKTYYLTNGNLDADFFEGTTILNDQGQASDKNSIYTYNPSLYKPIDIKKRNTYSFSLGISQVINKSIQFSIFSDFVYQDGWLANPMQRVYFADKENYYIGNALSIPNYQNTNNVDVFHLADDIERLPLQRIKTPIGTKWNFYINEFMVFRLYYRYYVDNWAIQSNTINFEIPLKIGYFITLYPSYRFYNQTASKYFAGYEQHLSSERFYTSDYDLSKFNANQIGFGIQYNDAFEKISIWKLHFKTFALNYAHYQRTNGLQSNIVSLHIKITTDSKPKR